MRFHFWFILMVLLYPFSVAYGQIPDNPQVKISQPCHCVAFRLDDVQDYYLNAAQMKVIGTFEQRNASLTVGVIGNYIGNDATLAEFLGDKINSDRFALDVANHGWNHEDFSVLNMREQSELLAKSNNNISERLGIEPVVFIPPFNRMNDETLSAMAENKLQVVSANVTNDNGPYVVNWTAGTSSELLFHYPATAKTGDLNADNTQWLAFDHKTTMSEVKTSMGKYGYAVVMMHPQEFSVRVGTNFQNVVDSDQLAELELLLYSVEQEGYKIVTLSELGMSQATVPEFTNYILLASAVPLAIAMWLLRSLGRLYSRINL